MRASTPPDQLLAEYQRRRKQLLAARGLDVSELGDELMTSADDVYWFPNLVGPILVAAFFMLMEHQLSALTEAWALYFGLIFIAFVLFAPQGIWGLATARLRRS